MRRLRVGITDLQSSVERNAAATSAPLKILHESRSSSQAEVEENKGDDDEEESEGTGETKSKPFYKVPQKVFARDTSTGLLNPAIIRKIQHGPKSRHVNLYLLPDDVDDIQSESYQQEYEDSEETHVWHYFVHYQGWNCRWDRWVEEDDLYLDVDETRVLAGKLKKEAQQLKTYQNKNSRKRQQLVSFIQKKNRLLEEEHRKIYCIRTDDSSCSTPKVKN